jgi:Cellulase (glycosyl hydrolase family 5)
MTRVPAKPILLVSLIMLIAFSGVSAQSSVAINVPSVGTIKPQTPFPTPAPISSSELPYSLFGEDYLIYYENSPFTQLPEQDVDPNIWDQRHSLIDKMAAWGSNTARLGFSVKPASTGRYLCSWYEQDKMDAVVAHLGKHGIKTILDMHNLYSSGVDHQNFVGSTEFNNFWKTAATHYKDNPNIAGYQLFNEAVPDTWAPSITTIGQLHQSFRTLIDQMLAIDTNPNHKIFYPTFIDIVASSAVNAPGSYSINQYLADLDTYGITGISRVVVDIFHPYYFESSWDGGRTPTQKADWIFDTIIIPAINKLGKDRVWTGETYAWISTKASDGTIIHPLPSGKAGTPAKQQEWLAAYIDNSIEHGVGLQILNYHANTDEQDAAIAASTWTAST